MNHIQKNIGILNALVRITCGLTMLSWLTAKMVRRPWKSSYVIWAAMAAMKVAEGITQYCPVTSLFSMRHRIFDTMNMDVMFDDYSTDSQHEEKHSSPESNK